MALLGGYLMLAAFDPARHWPAMALSLATKMMAPALFLVTASRGDVSGSTLWLLIPTYVIWWVPLAIILWNILDARYRDAERLQREMPSVAALLEVARDQHGTDLRTLTEQRPQLVVFLRHFGCTFCRETLADLVNRRHDIEAHGLGIVLIHMATDTRGRGVPGALRPGRHRPDLGSRTTPVPRRATETAAPCCSWSAPRSGGGRSQAGP